LLQCRNLIWGPVEKKAGGDLDEEWSAEAALAKAATRPTGGFSLMVAGGLVDNRVPHELALKLVADAQATVNVSVATYFQDTELGFSAWGTNAAIPAGPIGGVCSGHVWQMLLDPVGYEARLVAFFDGVFAK
jgi:hypothetical protein